MAENHHFTEFCCRAANACLRRGRKNRYLVLGLTLDPHQPCGEAAQAAAPAPSKPGWSSKRKSERHTLADQYCLVGFSLGMYFKQGNRISLQFSTTFPFHSHGSFTCPCLAKPNTNCCGLIESLYSFSCLGSWVRFSGAQKPAGTCRSGMQVAPARANKTFTAHEALLGGYGKSVAGKGFEKCLCELTNFFGQ